MRLSTFTWSKEYGVFLFLIVFNNVRSVINRVAYVRRETGQRDVFGLTVQNQDCNKYIASNTGAVGTGGTDCKCLAHALTFLYFNNTCVSNLFVKTKLNIQTGCLTKFAGHNDNTLYPVFDLSKDYMKQTTQFKAVTKIDGNCVAKQITYINDFDGQLIISSSGGPFKIEKDKKRLSWNIGDASSDFDGRILRLDTDGCKFVFNNNPSSSIRNPCFAFKIQGTLNFPTLTSSTTSITKTSTIHPVSSSSSTIIVQPTSTFTTTSVQPSKSSSVVLVTSTLHRISIHPSSLQTPIISTLSSGTLTPTSTIHGRSATTVVPFKPTDTAGHRKNESKDSDPTAAIVGALVAVIGVVIVVVLLVVWRRRKRNQNEEKEKDTNKGNPTYGRGETIDLSNQHNLRNTDNDFEYDYAAVDGDPRSSSNAAAGIYQSLTKDTNRESVYTPLDRQQDIPSDQSTGYDKVEHPVFKPPRKGPTDPLYNVLARPNEGQLEPGTHDTPTGQSTGYEKVEHPVFQPPRKGPTDPLYNVLERPNGNNHDYMEPGMNIDKAPQNNEPVYNVLEGPAEDPDYNVLEDPNEQYEPEYNVLEGPGDKPDNVPVDGHDNVGYASTIDLKSRGAPIYAAPEGPISEPTYQPLNVNGPDENVYQPLDRKSRVVPDDQPLYHVLESTTSDA